MTLSKHFNDQQWKLLKQRAKRIEKSVKAEENQHTEEVLIVRVGRESYAIPVVMIQAVYENIAIRSLPSTPDYIAGIANIRGHITTVINIPQILDTPVSPLGETGSLILLALPVDHIAIFVQAVLDVRKISNNRIMPIQNNHDNYIQGVLEDGTIYLNIHTIVNDPTLLVDESI